MQLKSKLLLTLLPMTMTMCKPTSQDYATKKAEDKNGDSYEYVENDPMKMRLYTLDNGLKVYLSKNAEKPRIQTYIAVKAGSNQDPDDATGLAHYLEHMLFKGNAEFGTIDWKKESVLLKKISDLYEEHKVAKTSAERKKIYKKIDQTSQEAAKYAIANEYDKMISAMGAKGTNAHTWHNETIYKNDIPSNELEKFMTLEYSRFSKLVLRLFHTELETVYEEFNRGQDSDQRRVITKLFERMFPTHPYGTKKTIGEPEHLKRPSMEKIHQYFDTYYVPNNMAVVLSGDLDFEQSLAVVKKTFGKMKRKELPKDNFPQEKPITKPIVEVVSGPQPAMLFFAYRTGGLHTKDRLLGEMFATLMSNGQAGILDLNLNKKQKVLTSGAHSFTLKDYGMVYFYGMPLREQSLDDLFPMIKSQIEEIKKGNIDDKLIEGAKNEVVINLQKMAQGNSRANMFYNSFINELDWAGELKYMQDLQKITKKDVIDFAKRTFKDNNYVLLKKEQGEPDDYVKVDKPEITPVSLNRKDQSDFSKNLAKVKTSDIKPQFVDFKKAIDFSEVNGQRFAFVKNEETDLFELNIIWEVGKRHFRDLGIASSMLDFLGTDKKTADDIALDIFQLGTAFSLSVHNKSTILKIDGLDYNLKKSWETVLDLLQNAKGDEQVYQMLLAQTAKARSDQRDNKDAIKRALVTYAAYGENSDLRNISPISELQKKKADDLLKLVKDLFQYPHQYFYYGKNVAEAKSLAANLEKDTKYMELPKPVVDIKRLPEPKQSKVMYVDYDMVQAEIMLYEKGKNYDWKKVPMARLFNSYFGSGLSSIVFQEIREAKALAYSTYSYIASPREKEDNFTLNGYIGTQADKLGDATSALLKLMAKMPLSENQFNSAKSSEVKKLASERTVRQSIFWSYRSLEKMDLPMDYAAKLYELLQTVSLEDLNKYFNQEIKNAVFTYSILGDEKLLDKKVLKKLGKVEKMDLKHVFNHE